MKNFFFMLLILKITASYAVYMPMQIRQQQPQYIIPQQNSYIQPAPIQSPLFSQSNYGFATTTNGSNFGYNDMNFLPNQERILIDDGKSLKKENNKEKSKSESLNKKEVLNIISDALKQNDKKVIREIKKSNRNLQVEAKLEKKADIRDRKDLQIDDLKRKSVLLKLKNFLKQEKTKNIRNVKKFYKHFDKYFGKDVKFFKNNFSSIFEKNLKAHNNSLNNQNISIELAKKVLKLTNFQTPLLQNNKYLDNIKSGKHSFSNNFDRNLEKLEKLELANENIIKNPEKKRKIISLYDKKLDSTKKFYHEIKKTVRKLRKMEKNYLNLKSGSKDKKYDKKIKKFRILLQDLKNEKFGNFYLNYLDIYKNLNIEKGNISNKKNQILYQKIDQLKSKSKRNSYLKTIFKLIKHNKKIGKNSSKKTQLLSYPIFEQTIPNLIKDDHMKVLLTHYFNRFFNTVHKSQRILVNDIVDKSLVFDYGKFISNLTDSMNFKQFKKINKQDQILNRFLVKIDKKFLNKKNPRMLKNKIAKKALKTFKDYFLIKNYKKFKNGIKNYKISLKLYPKNIDTYTEKDIQISNLSKILSKLKTKKDLLQFKKSKYYQKARKLLSSEYGDNFLSLNANNLDIINNHQTITNGSNNKPKITDIQISKSQDPNKPKTITTHIHVYVPKKKPDVKVSGTLLKKGRLILKLISVIFKNGSKDENEQTVGVLNDFIGQKQIKNKFSSRLNFLYKILKKDRDYNDSFYDKDLITIREFWKVLVFFYTRNCYLKLFHKLILRAEIAKKNIDDSEKKNKLLRNLIIFLLKNKKYDFKAECQKILKLLFSSQILTKAKIQKLFLFNIFKKILLKPNKKSHSSGPSNNFLDFLHRKRHINQSISKKFFGNPDNENNREKKKSLTDSDENENDDYPKLTGTEKNSLDYFHRKKHNNQIFSKKVFNVEGGDEANRSQRDIPSDESDPHSNEEDIDPSNFMHFTKELIYHFFKKQYDNKNKNLPNSKKIVYKLNVKGDRINYFKKLFVKYGSYENFIRNDNNHLEQTLKKIFFKIKDHEGPIKSKDSEESEEKDELNDPEKLYFEKLYDYLKLKTTQNPSPENKDNTTLLSKSIYKLNKDTKIREPSSEEEEEPPKEDTYEYLHKIYSSYTNLSDLQQKLEHSKTMGDKLRKILYKVVEANIKEKEIKKIKPKCKRKKTCNQTCYRIDEHGVKTEIGSQEEGFENLCEKNKEEDGDCNQEEIDSLGLDGDCGDGENGEGSANRQINLKPIFNLNFSFSSREEYEDFRKYAQTEEFLNLIKPLTRSNEINVDKLRSQVENSDPFKKFDITVKSIAQEAKELGILNDDMFKARKLNEKQVMGNKVTLGSGGKENEIVQVDKDQKSIL